MRRVLPHEHLVDDRRVDPKAPVLHPLGDGRQGPRLHNRGGLQPLDVGEEQASHVVPHGQAEGPDVQHGGHGAGDPPAVGNNVPFRLLRHVAPDGVEEG